MVKSILIYVRKYYTDLNMHAIYLMDVNQSVLEIGLEIGQDVEIV